VALSQLDPAVAEQLTLLMLTPDEGRLAASAAPVAAVTVPPEPFLNSTVTVCDWLGT